MQPGNGDTETPPTHPTGEHQEIWPSILYFGTPVALVTTMNAEGTPNIGPMSSAWALGYTIVMGWESTAHTLANLQRERECVINLPGPNLVGEVEALAPLTGRNPPAPHKADTFRFEPRKFRAAGLTPAARPSGHPASRSVPCNSRRRSQRSTSPRPAPTVSTSGSSRPTSSECTRSRASSSLQPTMSTPNTGVPCSTSSATTSPPVRRSDAASAPRTDHRSCGDRRPLDEAGSSAIQRQAERVHPPVSERRWRARRSPRKMHT